MKLVILITVQKDKGLLVAEAWQAVGAPGVTIIPTHGLRTLQDKAKHGSIELPRAAFSMETVLTYIIDKTEERGELILSVVDDATVDKLINETTRLLGDLTAPHTGVLFVLDIARAVGVYHHGANQKVED